MQKEKHKKTKCSLLEITQLNNECAQGLTILLICKIDAFPRERKDVFTSKSDITAPYQVSFSENLRRRQMPIDWRDRRGDRRGSDFLLCRFLDALASLDLPL